MLLLAGLIALWYLPSSAYTSTAFSGPRQASSSLTVNLFEDSDVNAIRNSGEVGVAGITVNLYDPSNASTSPCATKQSGASGEVVFTATDTSACSGDLLRLEVDTSTYPVGMFPGPVNLTDDDGNSATPVHLDAATDASAATQMVDLSAEVVRNIGVVDPTSYSCNPENAYAMTTCFINGDSRPTDSPSHNMDALVGFPYLASGAAFPGTSMDYVEPDHLATMGEIGSTWGLAWSQQTEQVYVASFLKRHVALGPLGLDGIYRVDFSTGTPAVEGWLNVEDTLGVELGKTTIPDAATRDLPTDLSGTSRDVAVFPLIGTVGLGDVDLVTDEGIDPAGLDADGWIDREFLLAVDLKNKDVLIIDTSTQELVMTYDIPAPSDGCANGTHRPWAVDYVDGKMYVGLVCDGSAESPTIKDSLTVNSNLEAIVYEYDLTVDLGADSIPTAPTVAPQTVLRFGLDYEKGSVYNGNCSEESNWHPWRDDVPPSPADGARNVCWPTPIFADIDFSDDGNMLLAFMDRSTHQWGWLNLSPDINDDTLYNNQSGGDILIACVDDTGSYILENDATCGDLTSANTLERNDGPGGKEFFWGDAYPAQQDNWHQETANNGIAVLPGTNEVIAAGMDPYGNAYFSAGGINWYSTKDGTPRDPGYMLYASEGSDSPVDLIGTAGKSGGLGDVDLICPQLPITIGDYVWLDSNRNGVQDPGELPLAGVTVYLELPNGSIISTVTDANGHYYFEASRNQSYQISFDTSTSTTNLPGGVNPGALVPTASNSGSSNDENDSDLNGTFSVNGQPLPALSIATNKAGDSNHTGDAGFVIPTYDLALIKTLADGQVDTVYPGTTVNYVITVKNQGDINSRSFTITDQIPAGMSYVSGNGTDWTCSTPVDQTLTCQFSGDLEPQATTQLNLSLKLDDATQGPFRNWSEISDDASDSYLLTDVDSTPDTDTGNDNGPGLGIPPVEELVNNTDDIDYDGSDDEDDNDYADLFAAPFVSLGDTVWHDENNDGLLNNGEVGIEGVLVQLLDSDGNVIEEATTISDGYYLFDDLLPDLYQVRIPTPPTAYPLSSLPTDTVDNGEDDDDNGSQTGGYNAPVTSPLIDLQPGEEPADDGDEDDNSDLTVDFGFWAPKAEILLQKTVYRGHNAGADCAGQELETGVQGDPVTYCFVVTNTGTIHLNEITLSDPDLGIERGDMTLLSGLEPLAPDASMIFYYQTTMNGDLVNTATTSGNPTDEQGNDIPNISNPSDEDDAEVKQFAPDIQLEKTVYFGHNGGADCPGRELVTGLQDDDVTYCFTVTNTGDTHLAAIAISDADLGISRSNMTLLSGAEPLAPNESMTFYYNGSLSRDLINTADISGNPTDENGNDIPNIPDPTDEDDAEVEQYAPAIQLQKTVYFGHSNGAGCPGTERVTGAQGDAVTYCFVVTNTGDTYLDDITLSDPDLEIDRSDLTVLNGSEPLAPNESMTFYFQATMDGDLVNTANTSGNPTDENSENLPNLPNPTDEDEAEVDQFGPGIRVEKTVYAGHDSGASCPGDELVWGVMNAPATYCFLITNTGDSYLSSITLDDPALGISRSNMTLLSGSEPLAPNATMVFYFNGTIVEDLVNLANTSGNPTDENGADIPNLPIVRDDNEAEVELAAPAIQLEKTVYAGHNNGANCPAGELETGIAGTPVTYCFVVTNMGDTYLNNITLTDLDLGIDRAGMTLIDGSEPLAPGATMTFYYNGTIDADLVNTASTTGNPTSDDGTDIPNLPDVTDNDTAEIKMYRPGISIDKTVYTGHNSGASCPGAELAIGINDDPVTYCFVVTNTGDTYLSEITVTDPDLGIDRSNMTLVSGNEPLAPSQQLIFFYEAQLVRDLVNVAQTDGNPTDENGNELPNVPEPRYEDDTEVQKFAPAIAIEKTVYPGHTNGLYCPSGELVNGTDGSPVTYCFEVTNTGDTNLDDVQIDDATLGINRSNMTLLRGSEPLAPGESLVFFYEGTITANLVNIASAEANPTNEDGDDIPGLNDVTDEDDAEIKLYSPSVEFQKTVYLGHNNGASCPGQELASGLGVTNVTYCFVVANTGNTYLNNLDIVDQDLGIERRNLTLLSGSEPLAPNESMVFYYETVRNVDLVNRATVIANPVDANGNDMPNLPSQSDQDTAEVVITPATSIGDTVWLDTNADGIQDNGEIGLSDVTVTLYDVNGDEIATTTTDAEGHYLFSELEPGTYSVGFTLPSKLYVFSPQDNTAMGDGMDSDADPDTGLTISTELTPGEADLNWDAGMVAPPILNVEKKPNLSVIQPSGVIVYSIDYENRGLGIATNVVIEETIPDYTRFLPEASSPGWICDGNSTASGAVCRFEVGTLAGKESGTLDLSFVVKADSALPEGVDRVINFVTIKDDGTHGALPGGQNIDSKIVNVVRPTSLNLDDEPENYEDTFGAPRIREQIFVPIISRIRIKQRPLTLEEFWTLQGCSLLVQAVQGQEELLAQPNLAQWALYCGEVLDDTFE